MDVSYCPDALLLPEFHSQLPFDYEALMGPGSCWAPTACDQASDAGYFSATSSSLSPTSSVDSFSFSPAHLPASAVAAAPGPEPDVDLDCLLSSLNRLTGASTEPTTHSHSSRKRKNNSIPAKTANAAATTGSTSTSRRSWSRFPGQKRQTASEREKLRMRDLTKSLNYLRSFLPASVAPVDQTLTKIETLRLTMRYISDLAAQLDQPQLDQARGAMSEPSRTPRPAQQNLPFQPLQERPNPVSYVPEESCHHYPRVAMDTVAQAWGAHQQNQTTQQIPLQNHYQVSGSFCSPFFNEQYWSSPDLLQQTMFSS